VSVVATGIDQAVNFQIVGMSAQPAVDPVLDSIVGATASVQYARPESSALRGHPPLTDKDVAIQQQRSPVIPFPEPTETRRAIRVRRFWRDSASPGRKHTMNHELRAGADPIYENVPH
jgi:hypothetical protein